MADIFVSFAVVPNIEYCFSQPQHILCSFIDPVSMLYFASFFSHVLFAFYFLSMLVHKQAMGLEREAMRSRLGPGLKLRVGGTQVVKYNNQKCTATLNSICISTANVSSIHQYLV